MNKFEDLPIQMWEHVTRPDGWHKYEQKNRTISDLLFTYNLDDPDDDAEITQVLRHLRDAYKAKYLAFPDEFAKKNTQR